MKFKSYKLYALIFLTTLFYTLIYTSGYLESLDNKVYEIFSNRFDFHKEEKANLTPSVIIIEIDKKSVDKLGQWPWSRIITANLINKINQAHPSTIGINIMFRQHDKSSIVSIQEFYKNYMGYDLKVSGLDKNLFDNDKIFVEALRQTKTILSVYMQDSPKVYKSCNPKNSNTNSIKDAQTTYTAASMLCNMDQFHKASYSFGFINTKIDKDNTIRRTPLFMQYDKSIVASFALANLLAIDKNIEFNEKNSIKILNHTFRTNDASEVLLSFYDKSWYKHISAIDILEDRVDMSKLSGKIILIGTSLLGSKNQHRVTTGETLNGTDISATTIENILNDHLLWQPEFLKYTNLLFAFLFSLASIFILRKKRYFALTMFYIVSVLFSFFLTLFAFKHGIYTSTTYGWVPLILHFLMLGLIVLYLYNQEKKVYYKELSHSHSAALESMALVAGTKDFETGEHLNRTKEYMKLLANYLRENGIYKKTLSHEFIDTIYQAAPLHDIGKVGIPDVILQKPGRLDKDEFIIMKNHPKIGMQIISNAMTSYNKNNFLKAAYNIAYYHHERWDGSGYPLGLKEKEIPLEARLMAIVDVYDALTTERCYKEAYSYEKAETLIINERGRHFDPYIVDAFIKIKDKFRYISRINSDKKLP